MFKKKIKIDEKPKAQDKQTQLGPKPDDITCTDYYDGGQISVAYDSY